MRHYRKVLLLKRPVVEEMLPMSAPASYDILTLLEEPAPVIELSRWQRFKNWIRDRIAA